MGYHRSPYRRADRLLIESLSRMHYLALAADYDGTLAQDGHVDPPT